jgi:hypothetical protein
MQLVATTIPTNAVFVKMENMCASYPYLADVYECIGMLNIVTQYFLSVQSFCSGDGKAAIWSKRVHNVQSLALLYAGLSQSPRMPASWPLSG